MTGFSPALDLNKNKLRMRMNSDENELRWDSNKTAFM